jgi:hypothetical protein
MMKNDARSGIPGVSTRRRVINSSRSRISTGSAECCWLANQTLTIPQCPLLTTRSQLRTFAGRRPADILKWHRNQHHAYWLRRREHNGATT